MPTQGKLVVLKLDGDVERSGFQVTLEIGLENERPQTEIIGWLPPAPELVIYLEQWQKQYRNLGGITRIRPREIIYEGSVNQFEACRQAAKQLRDRLLSWLDSESFRGIDKRLREELHRYEPIRVLLRTQDRQLHRLPWSLWDFIERYPQAEIALSTPAFEQVTTAIRRTEEQKVRILAILGNCKGIDTETDCRLLEALPNAEVVFLVEPKRQQLNDQLWEQPWDILFFAGHSETERNRGRIYINPQDSLTIEELKYGLKRAIAQGLKIAIFNSCDGLGLAYELEQLYLPQIIVMREPVPDRIAQEFLKHLLQSFANGDSLYTAERYARERLQGLEHNFPCASWLPVIYQNPATIPPDWQSLLKPPVEGVEGESSPLSWSNLLRLLILSLVITSLLVGVRSLGIFQRWELQAFDQLMGLRPSEPVDERILVVTIDEADIQYQKQEGMKLEGSLSDQALTQLLNKLTPHQPRVIGSDIIHDFPFESQLAKSIEGTPQFITICRIYNRESNLVSIPSPPGLSEEQLGFTNFSLDPDDVIRRQLIGMTPDSSCQTDQSFNFRIALRYLNNPPVEQTSEEFKIGNTRFKKLTSTAGGYQLSAKEALGYQILLNYRSSLPRQVKLRDILQGDLDNNLSELVKDRIVLIGVNRKNTDRHFTPYSNNKSTRRMSGIMIHAQMVSQIISTVLEKRTLLWWWSQPLEFLWIGSWAVVGGVVILLWRSRSLHITYSPLYQGLAIATPLPLLFGCCFILLLQGGWVPLIPSALAVVITEGSVIFYTKTKFKIGKSGIPHLKSGKDE